MTLRDNNLDYADIEVYIPSKGNRIYWFTMGFSVGWILTCIYAAVLFFVFNSNVLER